MSINGLWHSPCGFTIYLNYSFNSVFGTLEFLQKQNYKKFEIKGFIDEKQNFNELAFIIDWKTPGLRSFTAFTGKYNPKETEYLRLNWFLLLEDPTDDTWQNYIGTASLFRRVPNHAILEERTDRLPFPKVLLDYTSVVTRN